MDLQGMAASFEQIGRRLKAYRIGRNLSAEEVAERIGVSRAAVYRLEKGGLVKIETLEKLSALLNVSLPSLMGVGVEYYNNAIAFFERLRQLDEDAVHILGNFSPVSLRLMSGGFLGYLRLMLLEALSQAQHGPEDAADIVDRLIRILGERQAMVANRHRSIVSIINAHDIERLVRFGLVGRFDLPPEVVNERREAARTECEHFIAMLNRPPLGIQIGVVEDVPSAQTFQVFEKFDSAAVTLSPYRLGDHPNIVSGIAMVTSAPEAVRMFKNTINRQWETAHKGESGARILTAILNRADDIRPLRAVTSTARNRQSS